MSALTCHARNTNDAALVGGLTVQDYLALSALVARYWLLHDRMVEGCPSQLYLERGRMQVGSALLDDRRQIAQWYSERRVADDQIGRRTRHVMSNFSAQIAGKDDHRAPVAAVLRFLATVYSGSTPFPLRSGPPSTLADFTARCERCDAGEWRFGDLTASITFVGDGAGPHVR